MKSRRSLRMLLSLSLFLIVLVPFAVAVEPETNAGTAKVAAASCQRCGDGYCAPSCENERTCPADCRSTKLVAPAPAPTPVASARCGKCGDGQCVKSCGETALSCPIDCGGGGEPSVASSSTDSSTECAASVDTKPKPNAEK
jgi:hypothetical protein